MYYLEYLNWELFDKILILKKKERWKKWFGEGERVFENENDNEKRFLKNLIKSFPIKKI